MLSRKNSRYDSSLSNLSNAQERHASSSYKKKDDSKQTR